jgi:hypothetical protein
MGLLEAVSREPGTAGRRFGRLVTPEPVAPLPRAPPEELTDAPFVRPLSGLCRADFSFDAAVRSRSSCWRNPSAVHSLDISFEVSP